MKLALNLIDILFLPPDFDYDLTTFRVHKRQYFGYFRHFC